jgi:hypothetical protein
MRSSSYLLAAAAGFGLIVLSTPRADAMTTTSPAGLRAGLEAVDLTEPVHCRRETHKHVRGHGWSKGCGPGVVIREGGPSITIQTGTTDRSGARSGSRSGNRSRSGGGSTTTNTGTGAGATSTKATTTTGGATTTTGGTGATTLTTGGTSPTQTKPPAASESTGSAPKK